MLRALMASMKVVRQYQRGEKTFDGFETKSDSTIVTACDYASDEAGKAELRKIHEVILHGEESGEEGEGDTIIYLDPLDGTTSFAFGGGTSTVIVAAVEKKSGEVFHCLVGEPQSGRVWRASKDTECEFALFNTSYLKIPKSWHSVHAYRGILDGKSRVILDSCPGFTRQGRTILSTEQLNALHSHIQEKAGIFMLGSNGLHHALIANGGKGAVGAITTAIGGAWDVCPVLLVLSAGGVARAFSRTENGFEEKNPLCVASYDLVISGNTREAVDILAGFVLSVVKE